MGVWAYGCNQLIQAVSQKTLPKKLILSILSKHILSEQSPVVPLIRISVWRQDQRLEVSGISKSQGCKEGKDRDRIRA